MKPATNLEHANVYLVINEKEIMVIDTGTAGNAKMDCYLDRRGSHLKYIQVMNEPEASSTW